MEITASNNEKPHFTNKIWNDTEETSTQKLMEEIELLKQVILHKEARLANRVK